MRKKMMIEVGEKLIKIRRQIGCDRKSMAGRLGITQGAYTKNEAGMYLPSLNTLVHLVEEYKISIDWLLFNNGPMYYDEKGKRELELEQDIKKLKAELEEKCNTLNQERKIRQEQSAFIESRPDLKEFLEYMERNPIFYYETMIYFRKYKNENKDSMNKDA